MKSFITMGDSIFALSLFLLFRSTSAATDPRCSGLPSGKIYRFPYPGDCTRYVECTTSGDAIIQNCANGEYFNQDIQECDGPGTSGCVPLTCPPGVVDYYSYPEDCTRYIECYQGSPEVHDCPINLYFHKGQKRCVSPPDSGCGEYSTSVEPPWTTPHNKVCWGVQPDQIVLNRVPGSCTKFLECNGAHATEITCPEGLYFDLERQLCDQPELSGCDDSTAGSPDPSVTTPINPTTEIGFDDPRCADGNTYYWPHPVCTKYIQCHQGHGYLMDCPSGLYFNATDKKCEDPSNSNCGVTTILPDPTSEASDLSTTPFPYEDPDCPWPSNEKYFFPYPEDCTKFLICEGPVKVVKECPSGLWFNPTYLFCDYPYLSGCVQIR